MYSEEELLPLSSLQHLVFCERQWALIHLEQQWAENELTRKVGTCTSARMKAKTNGATAFGSAGGFGYGRCVLG